MITFTQALILMAVSAIGGAILGVESSMRYWKKKERKFLDAIFKDEANCDCDCEDCLTESLKKAAKR